MTRISRRAFIGGAAGLAGLVPRMQAVSGQVGGSESEAQAVSTLEHFVERHCERLGIPGMTVCVTGHNEFSAVVTAGIADVDLGVPIGPEHLFQIGSISKMMTALVVWSLIDEGKLSPEKRLVELMPEIPIRNGDGITLQHLLDHTSGLPRDVSPFLDGGLWTGFAPGSRWAYSNLGYRLAGMIAERTDGRSFQDCVESRVLRPLGMKQSFGAIRPEHRARYPQGYEPALMDRPAIRPGPLEEAPWVSQEAASGCVGATASDMGLFLRFLVELARGNGEPVLSGDAAVRFMNDPAEAPGWGEGARYGNGIAHVEIDGRRFLQHTGGMVSFCSSLHVDVEAGVAAFASSNVHWAFGYRPRDVTLRACELLRAAHGSSPTPAAEPATVKEPQRFLGEFTSRSGDRFEIVSSRQGVAMRRAGGTTVMQPIGDTAFACEDESFRLTGLVFEVKDRLATRAWSGDVEYLRKPEEGFHPAASSELMAMTGRYDTDDRRGAPIRVFARQGKLWLHRVNYTSELTKLDNGDWRLGEEDWSPDWVRFDSVVAGRPQRMLISGTPYYRRFS